MKRLVFAAVAIVTFVYLIIGAVVFHFLEGANETDSAKTFAKQHEEFLQRHRACVSDEELEKFVEKVLKAHSEGVQVAVVAASNFTGNKKTIDEELDDTRTNWDIASAILFCVTVISTIGYGNLSPKTQSGRLFCIFYTMVGVPLFAMVMLGTGERMQIPLKKLQAGRAWVKHDSVKDAKVKSIVVLTTGSLVLLFVPSIVFSVTQKWTFLEAIYYTIITLTTVGFGDFVPGYFDNPEDAEGTKNIYYVYRIILGLWIWIGLSWVALVLSEISTFMQSQIVEAATDAQNRLSNLETIVKKKAQETRSKIKGIIVDPP